MGSEPAACAESPVKSDQKNKNKTRFNSLGTLPKRRFFKNALFPTSYTFYSQQQHFLWLSKVCDVMPSAQPTSQTNTSSLSNLSISSPCLVDPSIILMLSSSVLIRSLAPKWLMLSWILVLLMQQTDWLTPLPVWLLRLYLWHHRFLD